MKNLNISIDLYIIRVKYWYYKTEADNRVAIFNIKLIFSNSLVFLLKKNYLICEKMLIPLTIREMEIKTKIRYYLTLPQIAIIQKKKVTQRKQELANTWRNQNLHILLEEIKMVGVLWKTVWRFLKSLKIELAYDPEILLLAICPKKLKIKNMKRLKTCRDV